MRTASDTQAAESIRRHHLQLRDELRSRVLVTLAAVHGRRPYEGAREAVVDYLDGELLPHAAAEEHTLYPAGEPVVGALLIQAMRDEHQNLIDHVDQLRGASNGIEVASTAASILALFESHLSKENDLLVPGLISDPETSLALLLDGMHELVG